MKLYKKKIKVDIDFDEEKEINEMIDELGIYESKIFQITIDYINSNGQYNVDNYYLLKIYERLTNCNW